MALFVTNSAEDVSIRKEWISRLEIQEIEDGEEIVGYKLVVSMSNSTWERSVIFETDDTLEGIQTKAATVLSALEA